MPLPPYSLTPAELGSLLEAERGGAAFVAYRDGAGDLRLAPLGTVSSVTIGRGRQNDLELGWDAEVSRTHAQLLLIGEEWMLVDDGLSRNGSFVNGERIQGRRRLVDGDVLRVGRTSLVFRAPGLTPDSTAVGELAAHVKLTEGERRVLVALCRPLFAPGGAGMPAGNREIAGELHLTSDGVKTHIRSLFAKLGIEDLPQYRKRTELARRAIETGLVTRHELGA
ncbi:MAG: FHA domain-containing protein [Thermoleophilaceae bacterium]|nr:FHA domain-containing protein [Thermoleophilaceae bacterium]